MSNTVLDIALVQNHENIKARGGSGSKTRFSPYFDIANFDLFLKQNFLQNWKILIFGEMTANSKYRELCHISKGSTNIENTRNHKKLYNSTKTGPGYTSILIWQCSTTHLPFTGFPKNQQITMLALKYVRRR